eukprot:15011220-Heterocapsa_arctica.AAC.1
MTNLTRRRTRLGASATEGVKAVGGEHATKITTPTPVSESVRQGTQGQRVGASPRTRKAGREAER